MAQFKNDKYLRKWDSTVFDKPFNPKQKAHIAGIYRCEGCGCEIGHPGDSPLPPYDHHPHKPGDGAFLWWLIVSVNLPYRAFESVEGQ